MEIIIKERWRTETADLAVGAQGTGDSYVGWKERTVV